jgi:hypothetical protein
VCSLSRLRRARSLCGGDSVCGCGRLHNHRGYAARSPFLSPYGVSDGEFGRARVHVCGCIQVQSESGQALSASDSIRAKDTCVATRPRVGRHGLTQNQPTGSGRRRYPVPEPYSRMCALSGGLIVVKLQREGQGGSEPYNPRTQNTPGILCAIRWQCFRPGDLVLSGHRRPISMESQARASILHPTTRDRPPPMCTMRGPALRSAWRLTSQTPLPPDELLRPRGSEAPRCEPRVVTRRASGVGQPHFQQGQQWRHNAASNAAMPPQSYKFISLVGLDGPQCRHNAAKPSGGIANLASSGGRGAARSCGTTWAPSPHTSRGQWWGRTGAGWGSRIGALGKYMYREEPSNRKGCR